MYFVEYTTYGLRINKMLITKCFRLFETLWELGSKWARGWSRGESKNNNRPLKMLRSRLNVPRARIELARPFRAKGFSCHYGFRHQECIHCTMFVVWTIPSPWGVAR